jgi:hypothetical protein
MALISSPTSIATGEALSADQVRDIYTQLTDGAGWVSLYGISATTLSSTEESINIQFAQLQMVPMCGLDDYHILNHNDTRPRDVIARYSELDDSMVFSSVSGSSRLVLVTHIERNTDKYYQKLVFKHKYTDTYNYNVICQPPYFTTENLYSKKVFMWETLGLSILAEYPTFKTSSGSITSLVDADSTETSYAAHALNIYDQLRDGNYNINVDLASQYNLFIDKQIDKNTKINTIEYLRLSDVNSFLYGLDIDLILKKNEYYPNDYKYNIFFATGKYNQLLGLFYHYCCKIISLKVNDTEFKWYAVGNIQTWTTESG